MRYEDIQILIGGMTQAIRPSILKKEQYALGVNITSRGGMPHTRPVFKDTSIVPASGTFQGAELYRLDGIDRLVCVISGRVYAINMNTGVIIDHGLHFNVSEPCFFRQADRYMIVQDGETPALWADAKWPVIIHEDTLADQTALPDFERVPKGGPMAYGHGRLFVSTAYIYNAGAWANQGRVGFMAGDIKLTYDPSSLLGFEETWTLSEGGRFDLPEELGYITGMELQHNVMTSVGQGPLMVFAKNGASSFMVNSPRANWKGIDFSVVMYREGGTYSHASFVHNNSDIIFRATDGIRTLAQSTTESQGTGLVNRPISGEAQDLLALDTIAVLPKVSAVVLDNRILMTTNPDTYGFKSLLSLDADSISNITQPATPIYDGIWTGFEFLHILKAIRNGKESVMVFVRSQAGATGLYYLDESEYLDGTSSRPVCRVVTGYKYFASVTGSKKMMNATYWFSDVKGQVDFTMYYRPGGYPYWSTMTSGTINSDPTGENLPFRMLSITAEEAGSDAVFGELLDSGENFEFCLEWTGHAQLDLCHVEAEEQTVDKKHIADTLDGTAKLAAADTLQVELNNYEYRVV